MKQLVFTIKSSVYKIISYGVQRVSLNTLLLKKNKEFVLSYSTLLV